MWRRLLTGGGYYPPFFADNVRSPKTLSFCQRGFSPLATIDIFGSSGKLAPSVSAGQSVHGFWRAGVRKPPGKYGFSPIC